MMIDHCLLSLKIHLYFPRVPINSTCTEIFSTNSKFSSTFETKKQKQQQYEMAKPRPQMNVFNPAKQVAMAATGGGVSMGSNSDKRWYEDTFLKPAVTAAVGAAVGKYTIFPEGSVMFGETPIPLWVATAVALYGAGVVGELLSTKVFPYLSRGQRWEAGGMVAGLVQPAAVGLANGAVWSLVNSGAATEKGVANIFLLGAASEIAGDYIYNHFVLPMI